MSYSLVLGSYVAYKGVMHIALGYTNGLVKLINPLSGNRKVNVKREKVTTTSNKCCYVNYESSSYLVTAKNIIISLTTGKVMKWGDEHRERQDILMSAHANSIAHTGPAHWAN